jgi:hypothetical protein
MAFSRRSTRATRLPPWRQPSGIAARCGRIAEPQATCERLQTLSQEARKILTEEEKNGG